MARVSFLLPLYNGAAYLEETLTALLHQSYQDFDILIVNDGSTDDWQEIVERLDDPKIHVHSQENAGLVEALNNGAKLLDCEFLARIDADDIALPNRLENQLDYMHFTGVDAMSSRVLNIDDSGVLAGIGMGSGHFFAADPEALPANEPYLPHPFMTIRLDVLKKIGFYRHAHLAEDADLCWRLAEGYKIGLSDTIAGKYRIHSASISSLSIARGRVQAVYSQLAALNAQRVKKGENEIAYQRRISDEVARAKSLPDLIAPYEAEIDNDDEVTWLKAASIAKLVDLGRWRNYVLESGDLEFAEDEKRTIGQLRPWSRAKFEENLKLCHAKRAVLQETS